MADFQRRHYEQIAAILDEEVRGLGEDTVNMRWSLADRFARMFGRRTTSTSTAPAS